MTQHRLKEMGCYFNATVRGEKPFTIRENSDRNFQKGDAVLVTLIPEHPGNRERTYFAEITTVCTYAQQAGYVVLGLKLIQIDGVNV